MKIEISNLRKTFGDTVACDIQSLTMGDGEIIGLVGNNGAGKTTLFRLMLDLQRADSGSVKLTPSTGEAIDVAKSEEWKNYTGAYIDESFLIDFLTPEEYFTFIAKTAGIPRGEAARRMEAFGHLVGDETIKGKTLIRDLSAGNKQKVGIMSALFRHPELVVLDEPFNFLDPSSQNLLKSAIADYSHSHNATIVISSHNLAHTVGVSTRIILLEHGKVLRDIPNNGDSKAQTELDEYFKV